MATTAASDQVLEFRLGDETYCVSIDYVTEIVDVGDLTTVPNAPPYVEGVMDLRGRTTAIVNPKDVFGIREEGPERRVVVFDPTIAAEGDAVGWLVDEVQQVVKVDDERVDDPPGDGGDGAVTGVVKREDGFVVWVDPAAVHSE
ncbi:chemotaxis protein CheW [Halomicrobium salinisoli]|uniref:chemotaxis protein CheW n=1 Tax=Halomicrobium salinisoli TaxID=2878391 RepID=UPI001CF091DA|nr:chemotaxis protein CheW [Halomicrobium salinisoli]